MPCGLLCAMLTKAGETQGYVELMGLGGIFAWQRLWQRGRPISAPCVLGSCVSYQHMHGWSSSDGCRPGFAVRQLFWRVCMFPAMGAGAAVLLGGFLGGGVWACRDVGRDGG